MKYRIGLCQMKTGEDREKNFSRARDMIDIAIDKNVDVVALPEMWNCPYSNLHFPKYAEIEGGTSFQFMSSIAKDKNIYLFGGSVPERYGDKLFNTSYVFDRNGEMIGKHRKAHMFDIEVDGGTVFRESDTLTAGDYVTVVETEFGKIGVAICYDVRFPEFIRKTAMSGAHLIVLPAAFSMSTGPMHWDVIMRGRALDNQIYIGAIGPARNEEGCYQAYGHSMVVNPWGEIVGSLGYEEGVVVSEIDLEFQAKVRRQLPLLEHMRHEIY